eukprot:1577922-Rhodomonas_salina.1
MESGEGGTEQEGDGSARRRCQGGRGCKWRPQEAWRRGGGGAATPRRMGGVKESGGGGMEERRR